MRRDSDVFAVRKEDIMGEYAFTERVFSMNVNHNNNNKNNQSEFRPSGNISQGESILYMDSE